MKRILPLVSLVVILVGSSVAQSNQAPVQAQVVVPRLIRFTGQLPGATGTVGITFTLHKSQQDHASLWIETQNVQLDSAGKYSVLLGVTKPEGIPTDVFSSGEAQWLGVQVQGKAEQPRVLFVSVPYALRAAEADTLAGHAPADFVTTDKLTSAVQEQMHTPSAPTTGATVHKDSIAKPAVTTSGATNFTAKTTSQVVLVTQQSTGAGLVATAGNNYALSGTSTNIAVYGASNGAAHATAAAVEGVTTSTTGRGIYGWANTSSGKNFGVYGQANSTSGTAVSAVSTAKTGSTVGVEAQGNSPSGTVAILQSRGGGKILSGQTGSSNTEVLAVDGSGDVSAAGNVSAGGYLFAPSFVEGGFGYFTSSSGYGVEGASSSGTGVRGVSTSSTGVTGSSSSGTGVSGSSSSGYGVYGTSPNNYGVVGVTNSGNGVYGQVSASSQAGVIGRQLDASGNWGLYAYGNIGASGTKSSVVSVDNNTRQVALYAVESPGVWFEDYGSSRLVHGVASITIDPAYAQTVNTGAEYHVFLTPDGDCDGLYVATRKATGFEVRELHQGTSNVAFSYRIVALRRGYETTRLADVTRATPRLASVTPPVAQSAADAPPQK